MNYEITPLTDRGIGAEIRGLDLREPVNDELRKRLNAEFAKHHVLVFRDQKLSAAEFACAGEIFGELMSHHHKDVRAEGHPEVYEVRNIQVAPGKYRINGGSFHTDHSNHPIPPKATALHPISLPSYGGDTQFVDMHAAYDDLPEATKQRIERLRALHVFESKFSPRKLKPLDEKGLAELPPPSKHPLVRVHPENGRKALYLNPVRIEAIDGLSEAEALALVAELVAHATQKKYEYRHQWRYGDMVIWDNRSVMHQANGDYDMNEVRHLHRIMVKGEPVIPADRASAREGMKLVKSFVSQTPLAQGRRAFFRYRDLGVEAASGGRMRAYHNTCIAGMTEPTGWHYHDCEMQFVYVMKGTLTIEFEDGTVGTFTAGDSFFIPGGVRHNEIYVSEDKETLEVSIPGKIGTVNVERPAGLPEKLKAVSNERP
jgi:taurine dioxygenase